MAVEMIPYILNALLYSMVTIMDILIIWATIRTGEISRNLVLYTILTAVVLDIGVYLNTVIHDIPSFLIDTDISTEASRYISVFLLCQQWFSQLFLLHVLSIIHFIAVFSPTRFRSLSIRHVWAANIGIIIMSATLTAPLFTAYCGYTYIIDGHYWYFDFSKPYSYIYNYVNLALQAVCVVFILLADTVIVWKVSRLRTSLSLGQVMSAPTAYPQTNERKKTTRRETRLALNFLLLSVCFLVMTFCYNFVSGYGIWCDLAKKLSYCLNLSKWAIYALRNASIRGKILSLIGVKVDVQTGWTTSVIFKVQHSEGKISPSKMQK